MYRVIPGKYAQKFLKKCDKVLAERLLKKMRELAVNPFPSDVIRVSGRKEKVFRVRVGDQRILYIVRYNPNKLIIAKVDKRPRVYG